MKKLKNRASHHLTSHKIYLESKEEKASVVNYIHVKELVSYFPGEALPQNDNVIRPKIIEFLRPVFIFAQVCGIIPLKGSWGHDSSEYSFSWRSCEAIYSMLLFVFIICYNSSTIYWIYKINNFDIFLSAYLVYSLSVTLALIGFVRFAKRWPTISKKWEELEKRLPVHENEDSCFKLRRQVSTVLVISCIIGFAENLLSNAADFIYIKYCVKSDLSLLETYAHVAFGEVFSVIEYSHFLLIFLVVAQFQFKLAHNFIHSFLIVIAKCLANNFERLNKRLELVKGKKTENLFWVEQRKLYKAICDLSIEVDESLCVVTIISSGSSLYSLTLSVLEWTNLSVVHSCHNLVSIGSSSWFLLSKALSSSYIGDESKRPLRVLRCVPSESWCMETKLFTDEVFGAKVELSGFRFFYLNRGMLLRAIAFMITYELVLLQLYLGDNGGEHICYRNRSSESLNL